MRGATCRAGGHPVPMMEGQPLDYRDFLSQLTSKDATSREGTPLAPYVPGTPAYPSDHATASWGAQQSAPRSSTSDLKGTPSAVFPSANRPELPAVIDLEDDRDSPAGESPAPSSTNKQSNSDARPQSPGGALDLFAGVDRQESHTGRGSSRDNPSVGPRASQQQAAEQAGPLSEADLGWFEENGHELLFGSPHSRVAHHKPDNERAAESRNVGNSAEKHSAFQEQSPTSSIQAPAQGPSVRLPDNTPDKQGEGQAQPADAIQNKVEDTVQQAAGGKSTPVILDILSDSESEEGQEGSEHVLGKRKLPSWAAASGDKSNQKRVAMAAQQEARKRQQMLAAATKLATSRSPGRAPPRLLTDKELEKQKVDAGVRREEALGEHRELPNGRQGGGNSGAKERLISQQELQELRAKFDEAVARRASKNKAAASLSEQHTHPGPSSHNQRLQRLQAATWQLPGRPLQPGSSGHRHLVGVGGAEAKRALPAVEAHQKFLEAKRTLPQYMGGSGEKRPLPPWATASGHSPSWPPRPPPLAPGLQFNSQGVQVTTVRVDDQQAALRGVMEGLALSGGDLEEEPPAGALNMPLLKHQKLALAWMKRRENGTHQPAGGFLADDQGLGKTVSTLALILSVPAPARPRLLPDSSQASSSLEGSQPDTVNLAEDDRDLGRLAGETQSLELGSTSSSQAGSSSGAPSGQKGRPPAGTLVVCPTSVLRQWASEVRNKVSPALGLRLLVYHGQQRTRDPAELASYDIVLTTYAIVAQEVPKQPLDEELEKAEVLGSRGGLGSKEGDKPKAPKKKKKRKEGVPEADLPPGSGPLARVSWFRVVLDEAQSIKNCRTQTARACWGLRAKRRWCLSGTPIQNALDDLYSYFRFLRYSPYDSYKSFRKFIKDGVAKNAASGYRRLQAILGSVMLRRTKATRIDGQPIVDLPARIVNLKQAEFRPEERAFYDSLEAESKRKFAAFQAAGTLQKNYVNILWMLLRLRQACNHHSLVKAMDTNTGGATAVFVAAARGLTDQKRAELLLAVEGHAAPCPLCQDAPEEPVVSTCAHVFCQQCLGEQVNTEEGAPPYLCAVCRTPITRSDIHTPHALRAVSSIADSEGGRFTSASTPPPQGLEVSAPSSSKIDAVMLTLKALPSVQIEVGEDGRVVEPGGNSAAFARKCHPDREQGEAGPGPGSILVHTTEKAIVFSQWTSMLNLLEAGLKRYGFNFRRLDGTMTVPNREKAIADFNSRPEVTVIIMSLKAASLGLNLVAANHVLLLDVWWNPTTEDQAIDRAHRIGQTRTVHVSRFTIKGTIEDRILALQEKKRQMVANAFGESNESGQQTRLTMEELTFLFNA